MQNRPTILTNTPSLSPASYTQQEGAGLALSEIAFGEGRTVLFEEVRGSSGRAVRAFRCKPGDLVWKYRKGQYTEAQYQAATRLAELCETASTGGTRSLDYSAPPNSGGYGGPPPAAIDALSEIQAVIEAVGKAPWARLYDHGVMGLTVGEVAAKRGFQDRAMAAILDADLRALADHFGYDPRR